MPNVVIASRGTQPVTFEDAEVVEVGGVLVIRREGSPVAGISVFDLGDYQVIETEPGASADGRASPKCGQRREST